MLAEITPIQGNLGPDNSLPGGGGRPGRPSHPIVLPPLPGVWPPPGQPNLPVDPGFDIPTFGGHPGGGPIVIPGHPENPIALPPGIYPPLPPTTSGKYAVLIWVVGVGVRWAVVDGSIDNTLPPAPTPK